MPGTPPARARLELSTRDVWQMRPLLSALLPRPVSSTIQDTHTRAPPPVALPRGAQFHTEWVEGTTVAAQRGDAAAHASAFVPAVRAWANATLVTGAVAGGVRPVEADDMADELFRRYEELVAQSPSEHAMDHVHAYLHIGKAD